MPFQPINFLNAPIQGNPGLRDLVDNLVTGYQASQIPSQMGRQRQKEEMANALSQIQLQQEPQKFKAEMDRNKLLNSLTNMQIRGQQMDQDPNMKMAHIKALVTALQNSGMPVTPEIVSGLMRKSLGLDEQSPQAKLQQEIEKYRATHAATTADDNTTATRTANQSIIRGVDATLPSLQKLKDMKEDIPGQIFGKWFKRDRQVKYQSMVSLLTDSLVAAYGLPKTNESLHLVEKMVARQPGESDENYDARLAEVQNDLMARKSQANTTLGKSKSSGGQTFNLVTGAYE